MLAGAYPADVQNPSLYPGIVQGAVLEAKVQFG
jgi:hypothetical protein